MKRDLVFPFDEKKYGDRKKKRKLSNKPCNLIVDFASPIELLTTQMNSPLSSISAFFIVNWWTTLKWYVSSVSSEYFFDSSLITSPFGWIHCCSANGQDSTKHWRTAFWPLIATSDCWAIRITGGTIQQWIENREKKITENYIVLMISINEPIIIKY